MNETKTISVWGNNIFNRIAIFALIFLVCLPVGCKSKKKVAEKTEISLIDSVEVVKYVYDTIVVKEREVITKPVYFETEIPCNENAKGKVGSGNNYTEYVIKDGKVYLKTNIDSITNKWQTYYRSKFQKDSIAVRKQLEQRYSLSSVDKVYVYPTWFWIACILGVILLAWKIANFFKIIPF